MICNTAYGKRYHMDSIIKLNNPPIKETFCSFEFSDDTEWDDTTPGLIFNAVKEGISFKEKKEGHIVEIRESTENGGPLIEKLPRIKIYNEEKTKAILVRKQKVSFNNIGGHYGGWEDYFAFIRKGLEAVLNVLDAPVITIFSLGYLNSIKIKSKKDIADCFKFRPSFHGDFNIDEVTSFICGLEIKSDEPVGLLRVTLTDDPNNDINSVLYEIVFESGQLEKLNLDSIFDAIRGAHAKIERQFFNSLERRLIDRYL